MRKSILILLLCSAVFLFSCDFDQYDNPNTAEITDQERFFFKAAPNNEYRWLATVNPGLEVENGVFEIPLTDNDGNQIVGIGTVAIRDMPQIEELVIGDHIEWISDEGISNLPNLKKVYIGKGVANIRGGLFHNCPNLTDVVIHGDNPNFQVINNCLLSKDGVRLLRVWNDSFTVPESVKVISSTAFSGNSMITEIVIPEGVTTIESYAFPACENLQIVSLPSTISFVGYRAFVPCPNLDVIKLNSGANTALFEEDWSLVLPGVGESKYAEVVIVA